MRALVGLGARSGVEQAAPYAVGDVVVVRRGGALVRHVVEQVCEVDDGEPAVLACVSLATGYSGIVLEREVAWRSR